MEDRFINKKRNPGRSELLLFSRLLSLASASSMILELFFLPCSPGDAQIRYQKKFLSPWKSSQALEKVAQGGVGVALSGNVEKTSRHGPWEHGLGVMLVLLGWWLDSMTLKDSRDLGDSVAVLFWISDSTIPAGNEEMLVSWGSLDWKFLD